MKHVFSYGIWLGAIASYLLVFFEPSHAYIPYANNMITLYKIVCWITFFILVVCTLLFAIGKSNKENIEKYGTTEQFSKSLERAKKPKLHLEISRYIHYVLLWNVRN